MKNSKGVSLIALIITIIVIIILAAIVMSASSSTISNAQYAKFAQEFGEYADQVKLDASNVRLTTGLQGQTINNAQMYFMTANGITKIGSGDGISGMAMPIGYTLTNKKENNATYENVLQSKLGFSGDEHVAYVILDSKISYSSNVTDGANGSAGHEFYGDSNGAEYHFVTSNGDVFTLPGYPVEQTDGTIEYHIDTKDGHFYTVVGNSGKNVGDTNVNGNVITNKQPILAAYLDESGVRGINSVSGASTTEKTELKGTKIGG